MPEPRAGQAVSGLSSESVPELSPAFRAELLDPAPWREGLEKYALAMHLAVGLVDLQGRLLGPCLNPQPLWSVLRDRRGAADGLCPFALAPASPCTCIADALTRGSFVEARDRTGMVHFVVPLAFGGHKFGALIAGQIFDRYPEQLPLDHIAKLFGLSEGLVWQTARLEHPVSPHMLETYQELLAILGRAYLQGRYHTLLERSRLAELHRAQESLRKANDELEKRVQERTAALQEMQEKALQAERLAAIGQTAAGLAHESRNALQRSQACLELLTREVKDRPRALELIDRIQQAQDFLVQLYEEVREFAAPLKLHTERCHLGVLMRQVWDQLQAERQERDIRFCADEHGLDLYCEVDRVGLSQVFRNILENSLQACPDPVVIEVVWSDIDLDKRRAVGISMRNNGPPLTPEQAQKIFDAFFTTKTHGTGLGMAIAKRIVEAHGGRIAVGTDTASGAEIVITLPRTLAGSSVNSVHGLA